jgi:hypothetical protein
MKREMEATLTNYYGEFYMFTGRSDHYVKGCVIFCIATFEVKNSEPISREFLCTNVSQGPQGESIHSEAVVFAEIEKIEKAENW